MRGCDVVVVGCGGVAYQAAPMLKLWLRHVEAASVTLIDPDVLEEHNGERQWPGVPGRTPKVIAMEKALGTTQNVATYGDLGFYVGTTRVWVEQARFDLAYAKERLKGLVETDNEAPVVMFGWPDNMEARLAMIEFGKHIMETRDVLIVTCGNSTGMAQCFVWAAVGGEVVWDFTRDHDLKAAEEHEAARHGCNMQSALANMAGVFMTWWMLKQVEEWWPILKGTKRPEFWWDENLDKCYRADRRDKFTN